MLLCRRIPRVHTSIFASSTGHVRDRTSLILRSSHAKLATRESSPKDSTLPPAITPNHPPPNPGPALLQSVLLVSHYPVSKTRKDTTPVAEQGVSEETKHDPLDSYAQLRAQNPSLSASLPTNVLCRLAANAVKHGSQDVVDGLTADVLDELLLLPDQRAQVALSLLCVPRRFSALLAIQKTLSLLTIIRHRDPSTILPMKAVLHVMRAIMADETWDSFDELSIDLVLDSFLQHLSSLQPPTGARAVSYRPPEAVALAYALIDRFVSLQRTRQAFRLFQALSDRGMIPVEALLADIPPLLAQDFAVIVRSTLARSCMHWDWHHQGVGFIASIMNSQDSLREDLSLLALQLLHASLEKCSSIQFKACAWLMDRLVDHRHGTTIPANTIHLFYSRAMRVRDGESARIFYSHTQSTRVKTMKDYPSPQGAVATWLMTYLVVQKHDAHLARSLAKQLVHLPEPIPRHDRGRFIALVASQGFATEARALWKRYSVGHGHEFVIGNAATMLRMVGLFAQRDSWIRARLERRTAKASRTDDRFAGFNEDTDYISFARQVLAAFRQSIGPLEGANHFDLSSLARGHFMLGETAEGLYPLRVLIRRREIPDRHDINIALSAMARQSPRAACQMVDRMADLGLQPDEVTFGTVLHEAIVQGDTQLVAKIVDRARQGGVPLSSKTIVSLIQSSVTVKEGTDKEQLRASVRQAWEVVRMTEERSVVHTPNVGKCCIIACLHLGDPVMAFDFWARLVREKTEWGDAEQKCLRRMIGSIVRQHCVEGRLDVKQGRAMLHALRDRGESV